MTHTSGVSTKPPGFSIEGYHRARCIGYTQLGTIPIGGKFQSQIQLTWEMPYDVRAFNPARPQDYSPKLISKDYAANLYGKSWLKKHLTQWFGAEIITEISEAQKMGKEFDPFIVVGQPCQIKIDHRVNPNTGTWFEDVVDVWALRNEEVISSFPPQVNLPSRVLRFSDWDEGVFHALPAFIQRKIKSSTEYQKMFGTPDQYTDIPPEQQDSFTDEPPF